MLSLLSSSLEEGSEDDDEDEDEDEKVSLQTMSVQKGYNLDSQAVYDVFMIIKLARVLSKLVAVKASKEKFQCSHLFKDGKVEFGCPKHIPRSSIFMELKWIKSGSELPVHVKDDGEFSLTFEKVVSQPRYDKLHLERLFSKWSWLQDDEDGTSLKGEHSGVLIYFDMVNEGYSSWFGFHKFLLKRGSQKNKSSLEEFSVSNPHDKLKERGDKEDEERFEDLIFFLKNALCKGAFLLNNIDSAIQGGCKPTSLEVEESMKYAIHADGYVHNATQVDVLGIGYHLRRRCVPSLHSHSFASSQGGKIRRCFNTHLQETRHFLGVKGLEGAPASSVGYSTGSGFGCLETCTPVTCDELTKGSFLSTKERIVTDGKGSFSLSLDFPTCRICMECITLRTKGESNDSLHKPLHTFQMAVFSDDLFEMLTKRCTTSTFSGKGGVKEMGHILQAKALSHASDFVQGRIGEYPEVGHLLVTVQTQGPMVHAQGYLHVIHSTNKPFLVIWQNLLLTKDQRSRRTHGPSLGPPYRVSKELQGLSVHHTPQKGGKAEMPFGKHLGRSFSTLSRFHFERKERENLSCMQRRADIARDNNKEQNHVLIGREIQGPTGHVKDP